MTNTLIILGGETSLGKELIKLYLDNAWKVVVPLPEDRENLRSSGKARENLVQIPWNPCSLISAKIAFREGQKKWGFPGTAIIINPEPAEDSGSRLENTAVMEQSLNTSIHGRLYILREILESFRKQDRGILGFAETRNALTASAPVQTLISGAFHGLAEGILLEGVSRIHAAAFTTTLTETKVYAQFIKGYLDAPDPRTKGQWLRFSEKKGLFQSLPLVKRKDLH